MARILEDPDARILEDSGWARWAHVPPESAMGSDRSQPHAVVSLHRCAAFCCRINMEYQYGICFSHARLAAGSLVANIQLPVLPVRDTADAIGRRHLRRPRQSRFPSFCSLPRTVACFRKRCSLQLTCAVSRAVPASYLVSGLS